jgi:pimeloyl-ACP methyl ester carboxylesterase
MAELKCIYGQDKDQGLVLIFIHGLGGDLYETWMCDPKDKDTFWPIWIAEDCNCTAWTLGYDASLSAWKDNAMPLPDQGDSVLDRLVTEPKLKNRPLLFIGHSLGGLLIKTVIISGLTKGVARYSDLIKQVCGVVFIATPHNGADLANLAKAVKFLLRTNEQVDDLTLHNAHLRSLHQQFLARYNQSPFPVRTFAERNPVSLDKGFFSNLVSKVVVDPASAEPHVPNEIAIPLAEDHFSICKPKSREAQIHKSLIAFIQEVESLIADSACEQQKMLPIQHPVSTSLPQWFGYDKHWVGRKKLIAELTIKVQDECRVLLILGLTGIGKTALAEKLALDLEDWLEGDWKNRFRRANFDYFDKPTDFVTVATRWLEEWGEKLTPEESKPERLLPRLVKRLCDNRILVVIDSLERLLTGNEEEGWGDFADEWWEKFFFQILSAESCESRIIVTSQDLPIQLDNTRYQNFLHRHVLFGLDENEQEALFEITGFDVSEDALEKTILLRLGKAYKGHPLVLRVILGEITADFQGNVQAYWEEVSTKIVEVETAIAETEADATKIVGSQDEWQLHKLTRQVRGQVNKERLHSVFYRLSTQVNDAYILICASSVYRIPVQKEGWTMQLSALVKRLEKQECSQQRQEKALEELDKRFLVDKSYNHNNKRMLGQHNLVRSVALEHQKVLLQDLKTKVK